MFKTLRTHKLTNVSFEHPSHYGIDHTHSVCPAPPSERLSVKICISREINFVD